METVKENILNFIFRIYFHIKNNVAAKIQNIFRIFAVNKIFFTAKRFFN